MNSYICKKCNKKFNRSSKNDHYNRIKKGDVFCSKDCFYEYCKKGKKLKCKYCNKKIYRKQSEINKNTTGFFFCGRSCSAKHRNLNKQFGTKISKLEKYIKNKLEHIYPDLEIHFNRKDAINSELDIYIPSLKLAFELNGVFHYEPIFGDDKLSKIKNNDQRKFQACLENKIELCIIDTSKQKYFKEHSSKEYLDIITNIIDIKLKPTATTSPL